MNGSSKSERQQLRALHDLAYRRELDAAISELATSFEQWRRGEFSPFDFSDRIHQFHDGVARDLYVSYTRRHPEITVPEAVSRGILRKEDVPPSLHARLAARAAQLAPQALPAEDDLATPDPPGTRPRRGTV